MRALTFIFILSSFSAATIYLVNKELYESAQVIM